MKEDPPGTFDPDAQRRAWKSVLSLERPVPYFFIPIARGDMGWDLYVHYSMPADAPSDVWLGYLWTDAVQLLSILFPARAWTDEEIREFSVTLWGQVFFTRRHEADSLLIGLAEEETTTDQQDEVRLFIPCDEYNMPRILHYVAQKYGQDEPCLFRTIEYKRLEAEYASLQADYKRMGEIDDQKTEDVWEARAQHDQLKAQIAPAQAALARFNQVYMPLVILYVFLSLITIVVMAIALCK